MLENKEKDFYMEMSYIKQFHKEWRVYLMNKKAGFFPIFNKEFSDKLLTLSGNAVKLYLYLGSFANNSTGELTVSVERMQKDLNCTKRSIQNWLKELSDNNLIKRMQLGYKGKTHTFLLPYSEEFIKASAPYYKVAQDLLNKEKNSGGTHK